MQASGVSCVDLAKGDWTARASSLSVEAVQNSDRKSKLPVVPLQSRRSRTDSRRVRSNQAMINDSVRSIVQ